MLRKLRSLFSSSSPRGFSPQLESQESHSSLLHDQKRQNDEEASDEYCEQRASCDHERVGRLPERLEKPGSIPPKRPTRLRLVQEQWYLLVINVCLVILGILATWKLVAIPPTDLHELVLTKDGKSFPSGQLSWSQKFTPLPCGTTPAEALARGCHFDLISTGWLPPKCIDYELVDEFVKSYPWKYYRYPNGSELLPDDPDTLGSYSDGLIFTTNHWHAAHCLFMWKKLTRALVQGRMTDGETVKQGHTDHCSMSLLKVDTSDRIEGLMEVIYPPC